MIRPIFLILTSVFLLSTIPIALCTTAVSATQAQNNLVESQSSDDKLNVLLKVPGVPEQYQACKDAGKSLKDIPNCIWNGDGNIKPLSQSIKTQVMAEYEKTLTTTDKNGVNRVNYTNTSAVTSTEFSNDKNPAIKKLSEIIKKKLEEALYGPAEKNKVAQVSQTQFHDLYEAELSKGIVDALTSYCIQVDYTSGNQTAVSSCIADKFCNKETDQVKKDECEKKCSIFSIPTNQTTNQLSDLKKKNLADLENGNFETNNLIGKCIANVPNACYYLPSSQNTEACVVADYLKAAKKNLTLNKEISAAYAELGKGANIEISNFTQVKTLDKQKAVNITSKEVNDAFKDNTDYKKLEADASDCTKTSTDPKCKEFLDTNIADKNSAVAEYGLRKFVQEEELTKNLKDSNDDTKVTQYLKDEGFDDAKIKQITSNPDDIQKIKDEIIKKFAAEKEALITELSERVKNTTSSKEGNTTASDVNKLNSIQNELNNKAEDLKVLTRFSNLASSYLYSEDKNASANSNSPSRNLSSFQDEIDSTKDQKTKIQDVVKPSAGKEANTNSFIDVSVLGEILGV